MRTALSSWGLSGSASDLRARRKPLVGESVGAVLHACDFAVEDAGIARAMVGLVEKQAVLGDRRVTAAPNRLGRVALEGVCLRRCEW